MGLLKPSKILEAGNNKKADAGASALFGADWLLVNHPTFSELNLQENHSQVKQ
jgi:hypothetical protein